MRIYELTVSIVDTTNNEWFYRDTKTYNKVKDCFEDLGFKLKRDRCGYSGIIEHNNDYVEYTLIRIK